MTTNQGATATYPLDRFDLELPLDELHRNLGAQFAHVHRMTCELVDFLDAFLDADFTVGLHAVAIHNLGQAFGEYFATRARVTIDDETIVIYAFVNADAEKPRLGWDFDDDETTATPATRERIRQCLFDAIRTAMVLEPADYAA
jgi:hypothetical protein